VELFRLFAGIARLAVGLIDLCFSFTLLPDLAFAAQVV
jgi:hypothetical protein